MDETFGSGFFQKQNPKEEHVLEKALVGFPDGGTGWIIYSTLGIQAECASLCEWSANELDTTDGVTPDHGLWVWEGTIETVQTGNWEHPDDWDTYYLGVFRKPTVDEWTMIVNQENPWETP